MSWITGLFRHEDLPLRRTWAVARPRQSHAYRSPWTAGSLWEMVQRNEWENTFLVLAAATDVMVQHWRHVIRWTGNTWESIVRIPEEFFIQTRCSSIHPFPLPTGSGSEGAAASWCGQKLFWIHCKMSNMDYSLLLTASCWGGQNMELWSADVQHTDRLLREHRHVHM